LLDLPAATKRMPAYILSTAKGHSVMMGCVVKGLLVGDQRSSLGRRNDLVAHSKILVHAYTNLDVAQRLRPLSLLSIDYRLVIHDQANIADTNFSLKLCNAEAL
jgi:hypothetical protein